MTGTLADALPRGRTPSRPPRKWLKRIGIIVLAAVAIVAAIVGFGAWWGPYLTAHYAVRQVLVDPQSAMFSHERRASFGGVCGFVNARNRMGGYVGFRPYTTFGGRALISPVDIDFFPYISTSRSSDIDNGCDFVLLWALNCGVPPFSDGAAKFCADRRKTH